MNTIKNHNNRLCEFVDIGFDNFMCINCGLIISSEDGAPAVFCSYWDEQELDKNNKDMCSEEQINQRFAICAGCEFFTDNSCSKCGCRIIRNKEFKNKLLWKNERCPISKWTEEI